MKLRRSGTLLSLAALLAACGGGGGGGGGGSASAPTPTPTSGTCSLADRKQWVLGQMREWYLFPETLPAALDPAPFATVQDYLDALTATARSQGRDRFFTFITSIREEDAFQNSGNTAGFGIRLSLDTTARRVFISEAFEGAPALAAGIDRGAEIVAIGETAATARTVSDIIAAGGTDGLFDALGPSTAGTARYLRFVTAGATSEAVVTKTNFALTPVSSRYGAVVLDDGGRRVGYVNLRTFSIDTAEPALRQAFANFRAQGITEFVIDYRYNGGGLVSIAELMGDLLARDRFTSEVFSFTTFRPEKSSQNETRLFRPQSESVAPTRIAFIGTNATASASELVINSFVPYLGNRLALVGGNTFGKPVGQIGLDRAQCDDRLRPVAFATQNRDRQGDYFTGLASKVAATCAAGDDVTRQLGDPQEASTRAALDFLAGRSCTAIAKDDAPISAAGTRRELMAPERPSVAQREVPGLF